MIRTSIVPQHTDFLISIPQSYIGKKVEILVYAEEEITKEPAPKITMADLWGKLSDESAQKLHTYTKQIRNEWERDI